MMPVASLPMYFRSENAAAYHAFWSLVRDELRAVGIDAPDALTDDGVGYDFWRRPELVLSQTCGYPYRTHLKDDVHLVGTPDYNLDGCPPGSYYSIFVARKDRGIAELSDLKDQTFAYNDDQSQSGYHGPLRYSQSWGVNLRPTVQTGAHRQSAQTIVDGLADIAALDVVTWLDCLRYEPASVSDLQVIAKTPCVPGLPLICAKSINPKTVHRAVSKAIMKQQPEDAKQLRIKAIVPTSPVNYAEARFVIENPSH